MRRRVRRLRIFYLTEILYHDNIQKYQIKRRFIMKKKISLLMVVCMTLLLAACGKEKSNTFTVGFDAEFPPYGYMDDNGEYVGFDLDLAAEALLTGTPRIWSCPAVP